MPSSDSVLRPIEPRSFALAPKGPHSPRGPLATHEELAGLFEGLGLPADQVRPLGALGPRGPRYHVLGPDELLVGRRFASLDAELSGDGVFVLAVEGDPDDRRLAMWRNALWPLIHVNGVVRVRSGRAKRITMSGSEPLEGTHAFEGALLIGQRKAHVMRPTSTVEKFDKNARSWNGESKRTGKRGPNYPHFRWMRKFVGRFVRPTAPEGRPMQILDFGCGAGWVGIEAAKRVPGAVLSSFDPSPQMVEITGENAKANGVAEFHGKTGFGEAPPFGGDVEDKRYDLVISSGVVSFSPDVEAWLDGLT
ncbi:MAG: class I SAM-dependent methyltransferase, partial [Planctomycetota bacterium]